MESSTPQDPQDRRKRAEPVPSGAKPTTNPLSESVHGHVFSEAIEKYHDGVQLPVHLVTPLDITTDPMTYTMPVRVVGTPTWVRDATANDSDKSRTVPEGEEWDLIYLAAQLAATADVGNRLFVILVGNGTDNLWASSRLTVTASQTASMGYWAALAASTTPADFPIWDGGASTLIKIGALPLLTLPAGYVIRVYDSAAIAAAADDMTVVYHYIRRFV